MRKKLMKVILAAFLTVTPLMAEVSEYEYNTYSLLGFEGGYSSFDVEKNVAGSAAEIKKYQFGHGGMKIGAQTDNYRLFLSGRYFNLEDFDYANTMGVEAQYLFNFASFANFYLGVNGGIANMRFAPTGESTSRTISDPYIGGDAGFNIHLGDSADFEFGARVMSIQAENVQGSTTYKFDSIVSGYASIIFKYKMD